MPLKRKSFHVSRVLGEIRQAALKMEDDDMRGKLWRWYYRLLHAEDEIRAMVMDAEMRRLLDFVFPDGLPSQFLDDDSKPDAPSDDEDPPPFQKRLWDD